MGQVTKYDADVHRADEISQGLNDDVYGAIGELDRPTIIKRVVENIHSATLREYEKTGLIPVLTVAWLIESVWRYKDDEVCECIADIAKLESLWRNTGNTGASDETL
jgi:hypothetical protein